MATRQKCIFSVDQASRKQRKNEKQREKLKPANSTGVLGTGPCLGERKAGKFDWSTWNWPLPGRTTRLKQSKGRYTTDSSIYWPLVQNFLSILFDPNSGIVPLFLDQESKLKLFAVSLQEDGAALKPGLNVDSH